MFRNNDFDPGRIPHLENIPKDLYTDHDKHFDNKNKLFTDIDIRIVSNFDYETKMKIPIFIKHLERYNPIFKEDLMFFDEKNCTKSSYQNFGISINYIHTFNNYNSRIGIDQVEIFRGRVAPCFASSFIIKI